MFSQLRVLVYLVLTTELSSYDDRSNYKDNWKYEYGFTPDKISQGSTYVDEEIMKQSMLFSDSYSYIECIQDIVSFDGVEYFPKTFEIFTTIVQKLRRPVMHSDNNGKRDSIGMCFYSMWVFSITLNLE